MTLFRVGRDFVTPSHGSNLYKNDRSPTLLTNHLWATKKCPNATHGRQRDIFFFGDYGSPYANTICPRTPFIHHEPECNVASPRTQTRATNPPHPSSTYAPDDRHSTCIHVTVRPAFRHDTSVASLPGNAIWTVLERLFSADDRQFQSNRPQKGRNHNRRTQNPKHTIGYAVLPRKLARFVNGVPIYMPSCVAFTAQSYSPTPHFLLIIPTSGTSQGGEITCWPCRGNTCPRRSGSPCIPA